MPRIPHTRSAQIDPRRIGSVSLAANGPTGSSEQKAASQCKAVRAPSNLMCFEWEPRFAGGSVDLVDRSLRVFSREAVNPSSTLWTLS
jgi:hypothetical protein